MSDVVERAKAALEGVTEGPWDAFWGDQCCGGTCVDNGHGLPLHSGGDLLPRDARFIAAARSLLPELVAEVERLRHELSDAAARIRAFAKDNVHHGDMTPMAQRQWNVLADTIASARSGVGVQEAHQ